MMYLEVPLFPCLGQSILYCVCVCVCLFFRWRGGSLGGDVLCVGEGGAFPRYCFYEIYGEGFWLSGLSLCMPRKYTGSGG